MVELDYFNAKVSKYAIDDASIAIRVFGEGKPLVLIHGFGVHGYTWRKILSDLAKEFTCYVLDLPGFGNSEWTSKSDLSFTAQTVRLNALFDLLELNNFSILAQDTGASIARMIALSRPESILKLALINTEIPGHRPPFIPMHQFLAKLPLANFIFRSFLKIGFIVRSPLLFNQFYFDKSQLRRSENLDPYINPLKSSRHKMLGMLNYLKGIEWEVVDGFKSKHLEMKAETLLIWGEKDKTFPVNRAKQMIDQFNGNCKFIIIQEACLMPHEERPGQVLAELIPFLKGRN